MKKKLQDMSVSIVGLGLMGGSMALALRGKVKRLFGIDPHESTLEYASKLAIFDVMEASWTDEVSGPDLLILATPVRQIMRIVEQLPKLIPGGCLVIDLGSTKRVIVDAMAGLPTSFAAIGGHPMCGRERSGLRAAQADLYIGQQFVLCPTKISTAAIQEIALELISVIGAIPKLLAADLHDEIVAATSHLPYLVAATLAETVIKKGQDDHEYRALVSSGFRDTTRLASSNPRMIADILFTNRQEILSILASYQHHLDTLTSLIAGSEYEDIESRLSQINSAHRNLQTWVDAGGLSRD